MKNGALVRLIQPEVKGVITTRRINESTDEIEVLVSWTNPDGTVESRWFDTNKLEVIG